MLKFISNFGNCIPLDNIIILNFTGIENTKLKDLNDE